MKFRQIWSRWGKKEVYDWTDQNSEARLLEDVDVVVVGVPHGPAGRVLLRLLAAGRIHEAAMSIGPFLPHVVPDFGLKCFCIINFV